MSENRLKTNAAVCRWSARIIGALLFVLTVSIAVGQGIPNPFTQPSRVQIVLFALALILLGILGGWRWELPAGIISLLGWSLFVLTLVTSARGLNGFVVALALPGTLYVASAVLWRYHEKARRSA